MVENVKGLDEVIKSTIDSIKKGTDSSGYSMPAFIEFELAIASTGEGEGGLKIYVVNAGGKLKKEELSKIKFQLNQNPY